MNGLVLENISAGYDGHEIIHGISLDIMRGQFSALLGRNGSGKTTLLKTICGLIPARSGRCFVDGLDCTDFNERKRAGYISYIPQRHSKLQGVTVRDVVLMGYNPKLRLFDSPTQVEIKNVDSALLKMGLLDLADRDFSKLSEGQKQLIILTRTLIQNSPVMLMDEPDSALDFTNRHGMLSKIRELIYSEGKCGLITLHDPSMALTYCDKIILMMNGEIVGTLFPASADKTEIMEQLIKVYGEIKVFEYDDRFVILPIEDGSVLRDIDTFEDLCGLCSMD